MKIKRRKWLLFLTMIIMTFLTAAVPVSMAAEIGKKPDPIQYTEAFVTEKEVWAIPAAVLDHTRTAVRQAKTEYEEREMQELLAALIFCEAGNQPYEGQVAVGAVVLNRVRSAGYPDSIPEVIYQPGQFTPAMTGWLDSVRASAGYTESAMQAAADALAGNSPVGDMLYFDCGGSGYQIGDHYFH